MRTLNADLLLAQVLGYPEGGYRPAVRCKLWSNDALTSYDYSYNPNLATNRLQYVRHIEEPQNDSGVIMLANYDKSLPADLKGYLVHLGWGLDTAAGIKNDETAGAVSPALWVVKQSDISGAPKGQTPQLYSILELRGVWQAVLNAQPIRLGAEPYYWSNVYMGTTNEYLEAGVDNIPELTNKTVYWCLKYIIETSLSTQTGLGFYLDDLGTQDDGLINSIIPFPSGEVSLIYPEELVPFGTYGTFINKLLKLTKCRLRTKASLTFEVIYPQEDDAVNEAYYDSASSGHPFYEVNHGRVGERSEGTPLPNHIQIWGGENEVTGLPLYEGHWFDSDHFDTAPTSYTSAAIQAAYTGDFMPVTFEGDEGNPTWDINITSNQQCEDRAESLGLQMKEQSKATRLLVPMDASVELYDRISIEDERGL
uniref:Uncharacterized protein n=1 Tax=viral metagenome TaxID=1070528 RepID=A0A6M3L7C4_9ZZZZ